MLLYKIFCWASLQLQTSRDIPGPCRHKSECLSVWGSRSRLELVITTDLVRVIRHQASSCVHTSVRITIILSSRARQRKTRVQLYVHWVSPLYNDPALWFIKFCFLRWKSWWGRQAMFKIPGWRSLERVLCSLPWVAGNIFMTDSREMESCERNLSRNSPILMYPLFISMFRHVLYREFIENIHLRLKCCNSL